MPETMEISDAAKSGDGTTTNASSPVCLVSTLFNNMRGAEWQPFAWRSIDVV